MFDVARGASIQYNVDACVFTVGVAASKGLSCGEGFAFEVRLSFVRLPSSPVPPVPPRGTCPACPSVGSRGRRASALWIECCRVALSSVRGDGVSRIDVQSLFRICRHLGSMGRSQSGVVLMLRLSFA